MTMRWIMILPTLIAAACATPPEASRGWPEPPPPVCYLPVPAGVPPATGRPLIDQLARALGARGWRIAPTADVSHNLILSGRVVDDPKEAAGPYAAVVDWTLRDADGLGLALFRQRLGGTDAAWRSGDPRLVRAMVADAAERVVGLPRSAVERRALQGVDGMVDVFVAVGPVDATPRPARTSIDRLLPRRPAAGATSPPTLEAPRWHIAPPGAVSAPVPSVAIGPVTGAAGDGAATLATAMRDSLARLGVAVADDPAAASHLLRTRVTVEPDGGENPRVAIDWHLVDAAGRDLGVIAQSSRIRAAILFDQWGAVAEAAARSAADGVLRLLRGRKAPPLP